MRPEIEAALRTERTIDIVTTGRQSGKPVRIEIWFFWVAGKYVITGTPGQRDWFANLQAEPHFLFCLKGEVKAELNARAKVITDRQDRQFIFSAPETQWYRDQVDSVSALIDNSPLVEIEFLEDS